MTSELLVANHAGQSAWFQGVAEAPKPIHTRSLIFLFAACCLRHAWLIAAS